MPPARAKAAWFFGVVATRASARHALSTMPAWPAWAESALTMGTIDAVLDAASDLTRTRRGARMDGRAARTPNAPPRERIERILNLLLVILVR